MTSKEKPRNEYTIFKDIQSDMHFVAIPVDKHNFPTQYIMKDEVINDIPRLISNIKTAYPKFSNMTPITKMHTSHKTLVSSIEFDFR